MLVVAINFNKDDNPDLPEPYLIETSNLPDDIRKLIEEAPPSENGYASIDITSEYYHNRYYDLVDTYKVAAPIEGRIEKIVTVWY